MYPKALECIQSEHDGQVLKAILAQITSVNFTAKLQVYVQNRSSVSSAKASIHHKLTKLEEIQRTSLIVRNDMTVEAQRRLYKCIIQPRNIKEIRQRASGAGRHLKSEEYHELSTVLEFAFGEHDYREMGGGGLESHPRLTNGVLYRTHDNKTNMIEARQLILALSPPDFQISISSCYNYTQNYKERSHQAKQHHHNRCVNANVSLHRPPRIGVPHLVINLHWSSANVGYFADYAATKDNCLMISKDAKSIVPANIPPVQLPGKTWKKIDYPDHTWDQGHSEVVPMTFLFLRSKLVEKSIQHHAPIIQVNRTGTALTLINLAYYEPATTLKCLNEIPMLMVNPGLDTYFRNSDTGRLKDELIFVVDNGPAETPSSHLVQMCLVRLLRLLNLSMVVQLSFAEYHSKRNYVEHVHAIENELLSKHGTFKLDTVSKEGSLEHQKAVEDMANELIECLGHGQYGGESLQAFRGIKPCDFVFDDEETLKNFMAFSEQNKDCNGDTYTPYKKSPIFQQLVEVWHVNEHFTGTYSEDYRLLHNKHVAVIDKYTTALCQHTGIPKPRQPLPDYMHWYESSGELHYLTHEARKNLPEGPWDGMAGLFITIHHT